MAITPEDVITWGSNQHGQCGHGDKAETDWVKPRSIKMLHEALVTQVVCGRHHTLCVTATSQVYAWGRNSSGQLGVGDTADRRSPTLVEGLWALPVLQLAAGARAGLPLAAAAAGPALLMLRAEGAGGSALLLWPALLLPPLGCRLQPAFPYTPCPPACALATPAGDAHSVALTSNGFLFTWGGNEAGQLGLPHAADVATQIQASRTASERKRVNRRVNQRFLTAMAEMGIPPEQAELALHETGNVGVEVATEWLFSVPQDVLETHLAGEPGTPQEEVGAVHEDDRVLAPKRVALQARRLLGWAACWVKGGHAGQRQHACSAAPGSQLGACRQLGGPASSALAPAPPHTVVAALPHPHPPPPARACALWRRARCTRWR